MPRNYLYRKFVDSEIHFVGGDRKISGVPKCPNQPIANFRCISVAPEEARFSGLLIPAKITFSDKMKIYNTSL
ncbi:hypothetical protein WN51_05999 [Melipona quadrifasciata]|uniref:Uncharacterized protein n=1 Tax=Melipona quadrifasciata TaxID=166423 RepID=A0A0N0BD24_9HYME|nr:hypothetical protein WN51_05999 [Melipona quadrifasciata]